MVTTRPPFPKFESYQSSWAEPCGPCRWGADEARMQMEVSIPPRNALSDAHISSMDGWTKTKPRTPPLPIGRGLFALASLLASLGKEGEGLGRSRCGIPFERTRQRPAPHPSGVSVSVAGAPCDANAGSPLPIGRGGVCVSRAALRPARRCVKRIALSGGGTLWLRLVSS
jgi:hypothetical protein